MIEDLITESEYDSLPVEHGRRFVELELICRRRMISSITHETSNNFDSLIRTQYMTTVAVAAAELGVDGVEFVNGSDDQQRNLEEFLRHTTAAVTRIRLRNSSGRDALSVKLANKTKGIIEDKLTTLRLAIEGADVEETKRQRLLEKIEEFRTELHKDRLSFSRSMSALAVFTSIAVGTSFLADAPDAVTTIIMLIGQDKEKEDAEVVRLEGPAKPILLPKQSRVPASGGFSRDLDDDIPF